MFKIKNPTNKKLALLLGYLGEWFVVFLLKLKLYKVIKRRYLTKLGEIDIIASKGKSLLFIEVKARRSKDHFNCAFNYQKIRRILRVAEQFIQAHPQFINYTICFDIYLVNFPKWQVVKIY